LLIEISKFLKDRGIDKDCVIYNMLNIKDPRVDIEKLLKEFKKQLEDE